MDSSVVVAVIASLTAMVVAFVGAVLSFWAVGRTRRHQTLDIVARYRDPLLWAAFDLRSRLFNIVAADFLQVSYHSGEEERQYAQTSTLYVVAEFLGWAEILRRGVQFLDLGDDARNRQLVELFHHIDRAFSSLKLEDGALRLHRGQQRAIGELMISGTRSTTGSSAECIGYATFCARLEQDKGFERWFSRLRADIDDLANRADPRTARLVDLQNRLMDLIDFLDPQSVRFPSRRRDRLSIAKRATSGDPVLPRGGAHGDGSAMACDSAVVALHIFLSDGEEHAEVERVVEAWLAAAGLEVAIRDAPVLGSWSRTLWVWVHKMSTSRTTQEVAATLVRTVELRTYSELDAKVTGALMQSTAQVLGSLQNSKDAVIRLGAILIVKADWTPIVTQLSAAQQLRLDHQPDLLNSPAQILLHLGLDQTGAPVASGQPHAVED